MPLPCPFRASLCAVFSVGVSLTLGACSAPAPDTAKQVVQSDLVDVAQTQGDLTTFVAAVQAAGLEESLSEGGAFTVFAPTNAAFDALPAGTLDTLLRPENKDQLATILRYHVIPETRMADEIAEGIRRVETLQGKTINLQRSDDVKINNARVVSADLAASNGVIHTIDRVLLP